MSSSDAVPTNLAIREPDKLFIGWSDGMQREYRFTELRAKCPCATCREQRAVPPAPSNPFQILKKSEAQPLRISGMQPVGNYAYSIDFSDGHNTGIFTLEFLRELGEAVG